MKRSTRRTWHFTRHRVMTVQSMVAQRAQPLLLLLDLYLLPSYKPRQEVLRVPTTEQMSGCTEHKLVSDLRNNLKSHTPIQTPTVILIPILVILFSPPFSANTALPQQITSRLTARVQIQAGFRSASCGRVRNTTPQSQPKNTIRSPMYTQAPTHSAPRKAGRTGHDMLGPPQSFRMGSPGIQSTLFLGLWVPLTFFLPPQVMHVYQMSALHFFKTTIHSSRGGSAVNG